MRKGKRVMLILATIVSLFVVYNLFWYAWINIKYAKYTDELDEFIPNRSYVLSQNNYLYNVKFPDYLSLVGNLAVSTDDNKYAVIIWPSLVGDNEYGVQITDDNQQIYAASVDKDLRVIDDVHEEVAKLVENNKEQFKTLLMKAEDMWGEL